MVNERRWLVLIFVLYVSLALGYSLLMPIWEAPDEPAHYHLAWHLVRYGKYHTIETNYEAHQPRGYYYFAAGVLWVLNSVDPELTRYRRPEEYPFTIRKPERRFDWNDSTYRPLWGVYILRWLNIGFGGIALWLHWKTFERVSSEKTSLRLAALAFIALMPQYLHITSSVNNDTLGALTGAFLFYLAVRISRDPTAGWLTLVSVPLAILLPFITKLSVLPVSAAVLMTIPGNWFFRQARHAWLVISAVALLLGAGIVSLLFPELIRMAQHEIAWRLFTFRENAFTGEYIKFITSQIVWTYWGKVGWLAVGPPAWIIHLLTGLGLAGMVLHAIGLVRAHRDKPTLITWMVIWGTALLTILAVFRNALATRATQGRLLFPAIGALSLLMVAGWHEILPPRMQPFLPAIVVLLLVSVNIVLWLTGVLPIYYQPLLD